MLVPPMAVIATWVNLARFPVRAADVLKGDAVLGPTGTPGDVLVGWVRDAYLTQARIFGGLFIVGVATMGLLILLYSGIMALTRQRA
jgi:hypothetical protein